ncbi:MAG: zinc-dependent alcohol dehydrogenase [Thermomicrobiales bacterium]
MKRLAKYDGIGNIAVEEAPLPQPGEREVLIRNVRTLISRGSEIGRRYLDPGALDPAIMGYSAAGVVEVLGPGVTDFAVGRAVTAVAPHAEYVIGDLEKGEGSWVAPIAAGVSFEHATFHPLVTGAVMWAKIAAVKPGDTVAVLGQGLVGLLVMQALRAYRPGCMIAVDALPMRCDLAGRLGADLVVNAAEEDPVARVKALTDGDGADVVIDCVGGKAGITSFAQAQEMCRRLGRIHLIALYHGEPLPLDAGKIQGRLLIGGYYTDESRLPFAMQAMQSIATGEIQIAPLITHRFHFTEAKDAFDLLYHHPDQALGVLFSWDDSPPKSNA